MISRTIPALSGMALTLAVLTGCQTEPKLVAVPGQTPVQSKVPAPVTPTNTLPKVARIPDRTAPALPPVQIAPPPPVVTQRGVPSDWIPRSQPRNWQWIVIHHSATSTGGAAAFDKMHKAKGWDGLGYDFVIGNGTDTPVGKVEVGFRWVQQIHGAHAKTPDNRFNEAGIGICLVGNFDESNPDRRQLESLSKLVAYLMKTYKIPADRVMGHSDTGKATDCPGKRLSLDTIRRMATQSLASNSFLQAHADAR